MCLSSLYILIPSLHLIWHYETPCSHCLTRLTLNSPRRQTRTVTRSPKMWSQRWRSSSTTSTFLRIRRRRSPLHPWTRHTPDSSSSSSCSCSCRSSASRSMPTRIRSRSSPSSTHKPRTRSLSSGSLLSATSLTHRAKPRSKSQWWTTHLDSTQPHLWSCCTLHQISDSSQTFGGNQTLFTFTFSPSADFIFKDIFMFHRDWETHISSLSIVLVVLKRETMIWAQAKMF